MPSGVMDRLLTSPPLLGGLRHLTQLRLYNDYASEYRGPLSCAQHAKLLVEQLPNLTQLRSLNAGGALGLRVAPLRHLVFLQELDLYDCGIGPKAAPALAQVSRVLRGMPHPDLHCMRLRCRLFISLIGVRVDCATGARNCKILPLSHILS